MEHRMCPVPGLQAVRMALPNCHHPTLSGSSEDYELLPFTAGPNPFNTALYLRSETVHNGLITTQTCKANRSIAHHGMVLCLKWPKTDRERK